MDKRHKTALVTGGAVRIGRAIVLALARAGADVVIHCRRSKAEARELVGQVQDLGRQAWVVCGALDSEASCQRILREAVAAAGRLDWLVNNASLFEKTSLRATTAADLEKMFWINLHAPLLLMKGFARLGRGGAIVNLLDRRIAGLDVSCAPYVLSKKALAEATRLAAVDFAPRIRVNAVAPGAILPPPGKRASYIKDHAGPIPLERRGTPEEVAEAVLFLLSQPSLTGQILYVDGGQSLAIP